MPPDAFPPDHARGSGGSAPDPADANVVDPVVLAERRALRAEQAEQVAAKRAADAQALAAELARERARLEAELERVQVRLAPASDAAEVASVRRSLAAAEESVVALRARVVPAAARSRFSRDRARQVERTIDRVALRRLLAQTTAARAAVAGRHARA